MKNAYLVFNADGKFVGRGEGREPHLQDGEYFEWADSIDDVNQSVYVLDDNAREAARSELEQANRARDSQAYINKTTCAKTFLERVPDTEVKGDPSVIPDECQELKDEYTETHDLMDISPWDLARKIVSKANKSQAEALRRRQKLLALQTLAKPPPEPPNEN